MAINNDEIEKLKIGDHVSFEYGTEEQSRTVDGKIEKISADFICIENQGEFSVAEIMQLNSNADEDWVIEDDWIPEVDEDGFMRQGERYPSYDTSLTYSQNQKDFVISQDQLIPKFINYISFVAEQNVAKKHKEAIENGLCFGFSIVHSYMAAHEKTDWWEKLLRSVVEWDGEKISLDKCIQNKPDISSDFDRVTYRDLLEKVATYVVYNYGLSIASLVYNLEQNIFLFVGGPFVCEEGGILFNRNFSGHYDEKRLKELLEVIKNASLNAPLPSILLIKSHSHAWSLRYDHKDDQWYLYDPNNASGEEKYLNVAALTDKLLHVLPTHEFSVEVASWKLPEKAVAVAGGGAAVEAVELGESHALQLLEKHYEQFYDIQNIPELTENAGLSIIAHYNPDQTANIIAYFLADQRDNSDVLRDQLKKMILKKTGNGYSTLYLISECAPAQLVYLFNLAATDHNFKQGLITALMEKSNDGWTALEAILSAPVSDDIKNTAIEYSGGVNAVLAHIYTNFKKKLYDQHYEEELYNYICYLLDKTPPLSKNNNEPSLTIESLRMVKKMLGEGVLIGNRKYGAFSGKITPIKNQYLKKHVDAHHEWKQQVVTKRFNP